MGVLEDTDWSTLLHAYGPATNAPPQLLALIGTDVSAQEFAVDYLWGAILHQGSVCTATGPVAQFVAENLGGSVTEPVREALLGFLTGVVHAVIDANRIELQRTAEPEIDRLLVADDDDDVWRDKKVASSFVARSLIGILDRLDAFVEPVLAMLDHDRSTVRAEASQTAVHLARAGARLDVSALAKRLRQLAASADLDERCAHVMALGFLGERTAEFLDDPSAAVRTCAALDKGNATSESATNELIRALEHEDIDGWFRDRPPQFDMNPRPFVIAAVLERVKDFERLVDAAINVAKTTYLLRVDHEWGPLLIAAFRASSGTVTTEAQRRYLSALVENAELWDPSCGDADFVFQDAGLPYDRAKCAALVQQATR